MSGKLDEKFIQSLLKGIKEHGDDPILRKILLEFKSRGMTKDNMLGNLEQLRNLSETDEIEEIILDLMDLVIGFCNPSLSIFGSYQS